ncbi:MAG: thioredoxin family protein [Bacteroidales bacterium]|nr:thioredoxin family protein [Bacteroidales bacterium]MDZ4204364.1 thioredoxin family protein [Bacteroidales bacterium]
MKALISIIAIVLFLFSGTSDSSANDPKTVEDPGINFFEGTWDEALQKAKKEKKLIFLDVYATWCGPCKRLAAITFPDPEVGLYYNNHFINVRLDGEKGEGRLLAQRYGVRSYPSLLFIDHTGQIVLYTAGFRDPQRFIELGQSVTEKLRIK